METHWDDDHVLIVKITDQRNAFSICHTRRVPCPVTLSHSVNVHRIIRTRTNSANSHWSKSLIIGWKRYGFTTWAIPWIGSKEMVNLAITAAKNPSSSFSSSTTMIDFLINHFDFIWIVIKHDPGHCISCMFNSKRIACLPSKWINYWLMTNFLPWHTSLRFASLIILTD